jgi:hypothetical protein
MRDVDPEWIVDLYDEAGADGQAAKYSEIKEQIKPAVIEFLAEQERDLDAEAGLLIDAAVKPKRRQRRQSLKDQIEYILDNAIPEDASYTDPLLNWMVPLGTSDGLDKQLRYWTAEDFRELVVTAYRTAAEQVAAAAALDAVLQKLIDEMIVRHAVIFGDLWSTP